MQLRFYGLTIAIAAIVAARFADRRWVKRGGTDGEIAQLAMWAVPAGALGARLYHVVTDYEIYAHNPVKAFAIWDGGLGIPGGIAAGVITGLVEPRRRRLVQSGTVRPAIDPAMGSAHRSGRLTGRTGAVQLVPPDVPLRISVEPGRSRRRPSRRAAWPPPSRLLVRGLGRRVCARQVLRRTDAHRLCPQHRRLTRERVDQCSCLRGGNGFRRIRPPACVAPSPIRRRCSNSSSTSTSKGCGRRLNQGMNKNTMPSTTKATP